MYLGTGEYVDRWEYVHGLFFLGLFLLDDLLLVGVSFFVSRLADKLFKSLVGNFFGLLLVFVYGYGNRSLDLFKGRKLFRRSS